jgi:hypothetical protein
MAVTRRQQARDLRRTYVVGLGEQQEDASAPQTPGCH